MSSEVRILPYPLCGSNSVGRVTAFQAVGRGFESRLPLRMLRYFVYILKSEKVDRFYIGSTKDIDKRIYEHNSSRARWTKRYQPWSLVYKEEFEIRGEAVKRERELKKMKTINRFISSLSVTS